jgi:serine/threonine-protein kinase
MRLDLQRLLAGQAVEATPVLPTDQTVAMAASPGPTRDATTVMPPVARVPPVPPPPRRGLALGLVLVMIAAILVGAGALAYRVISGGSASVPVPKVVGLPVDQALTFLTQNKLKGVTGTAFSDTVKPNVVSSQNPTDGTKVKPDSTVFVTVSSGAQTGPVPDVTGQSLDQAKAAITNAGFTVGNVGQEFSPTVPQGQVTRTVPPAKQTAQRGQSIDIFQSGGKQPATLTNVTGFDQAHATQVLKDEGFNPVVTPGTCDTTKAPGTVISQNPTGGTVPSGSDVNITVNPAKQVPDVTKMQQTDAIAALQQAGFSSVKSQPQTQLLGVPGQVTDQSPKGGATACTSDTVTLTVVQSIGTSPSASTSTAQSTSPTSSPSATVTPKPS